MLRFATVLLAAVSTAWLASSTHASVTVYNTKAAWQSAAGSYSTITFTEFGLPSGTWLDEQYSYLGVHFTDGSDQIYETDTFITDGFGLNGAFDESTLEFDAPITTIAMDFSGTAMIKLYFNGNLIFTSGFLATGGVGNFAGLVSTQPFDSAFIWDPGGGLFADNLYFGPPIPTPSVLAAFALSALVAPRHRRRR